MRRLKYILLVFLLVSLYGCGFIDQTNQITTELSNATSPAIQATSSSTSTIALTSSPLAASTSIPTLVPQAAENAIKQLLNQEMSCPKPCLFGIVPGQTTLEEARSFYEHLNMNFKLTFQEKQKKYYETGLGFGDNWSFGVRSIIEDNVVQNMTIGIGFQNYTGSAPEQEWLAFRLNAILERYGPPSDVELTLSFPVEAGFPIGIAWYEIVAYFPNDNLIFEYEYE